MSGVAVSGSFCVKIVLKSINDESPICVGRVSWVESFEQVMITFSTNELMPFSSYSVFEGHTFADGTPFGVKI